MTRTWPVPRVPGDFSPRPSYFQRVEANIHGRHRLQLQVERDDHLVELRSIDAELDRLARRRVELLEKLDGLRDRLWPEAPTVHGRRPPALDEPPLPPVVANARLAEGRELRGLCLTILGRQGPLSLPDLHAAVHCYGYRILGSHPVKSLADAMAYEVRCGRAVRVRRSVYDLTGAGRTRGYRNSPDPRRLVSDLGDPLPWSDTPVDQDLRTDPDRWSPHDWPDASPELVPPRALRNTHAELDRAGSSPSADPPTTPSRSFGSDSVQIRTRRPGNTIRRPGSPDTEHPPDQVDPPERGGPARC